MLECKAASHLLVPWIGLGDGQQTKQQQLVFGLVVWIWIGASGFTFADRIGGGLDLDWIHFLASVRNLWGLQLQVASASSLCDLFLGVVFRFLEAPIKTGCRPFLFYGNLMGIWVWGLLEFKAESHQIGALDWISRWFGGSPKNPRARTCVCVWIRGGWIWICTMSCLWQKWSKGKPPPQKNKTPTFHCNL